MDNLRHIKSLANQASLAIHQVVIEDKMTNEEAMLFWSLIASEMSTSIQSVLIKREDNGFGKKGE